MYRGFIGFAALFALVVAAQAQTYYISETFRGTQADCQAQKTSKGALVSYTATVIGKCIRRGNFYTKYECDATTATFYKNCRNSNCTDCQSMDSLTIATCRASGSDWVTSRCGSNLLSGGDGVSSLDYSDNNCTDLLTRDFRYASSACFVGPLFNATFTSSRATCGNDLVQTECSDALCAIGCQTTTTKTNVCSNGRKIVCGSSSGAAVLTSLSGIAVLAISIAFVILVL